MKYFALILFALGCSLCQQTNAVVQFTNVECITLDKNYTNFDYCYIKAINRTYKYISIKAKLFQIPITNVTLNLAIYKKSNGYKPFMYNITQDACKFLKNRNSNLIFKLMAEPFLKYSNMNHECPFDHDVYVEKLPISHVDRLLENILPVPKGAYRFSSLWMTYNIPRAAVHIHATFT